jgi:putative PEP-CTERM system TPR-repeat lipoprotein
MALIEVMIKQGAPAEEVNASLAETIRANASEPAPHLLLIARLSAARDTKAALSAAQAALAVLPDNKDILDAVGRTQVNAGDDQQAISTFNRILSLDPKSAVTYLRLANLHERRKDPEAAMLNLKRAIDADPEARVVQQRIIAHAVATKDSKFALEVAKDLQRKRPGQADGFLLEGDVHAAAKNWGEALSAYRQGQGKKDDQGRVPIGIYGALMNSGKNVEADAFAGAWQKAHPGDADFLNHVGGLDVLRKNYAAAEVRFKAALAIDPKNVLALNNLAWLLAERGDKSAVALAERALAMAPGEAPVLDTLAKTLAVAGNVERAIAAERDAVAKMPERPSYRLNLAKLYLQAGDKAKAKVELGVLRELGAKFSDSQEVARLLKSVEG